MAIRNISVIISANVRKYTDGLRTAASATKKFQEGVSTSGSVAAKSGKSVAGAAREHSIYEKAIRASMRAQGAALGRQNKNSSALRNGNRALSAAADATGAWGKSMAFLKTASVQALGAMGGFAVVSVALNAVTKGFSFLVDSVTSFDTAITESLSIADEYGPGLRKQFEEAANAQAKMSKFDPSEIAEGYYHLLSAGLNTTGAIQGMGVVANFAQAGVMDMDTAAELAAQSTAALGLSSDDTATQIEGMTRVTDVLVTAALKSTGTVEDFAQALTTKFGTALSLSGRTVEEGATILMAYAKVGVKGRVAGTQAAIALRDMQKAAINNGKAMEDMNIHVFDSNGNMNNLVSVAKELHTAFSGMSDKDLRVQLKALGFQDRAIHAILPLIAQTGEEWDKTYEQMNQAAGASAKIAKRQMTSIVNQIQEIKHSFQELAQKSGRAALDALYKGWDRIRQPMTEIWENVVGIGKSLIEALKPAATLLGGAVYGSLQAVLQVVLGITEVLDKFDEVWAPFLSVGAVLAVMAGGWKTVAAAVQFFIGTKATEMTAEEAHTAALVANTEALMANAAAKEANALATGAEAAASTVATEASVASTAAVATSATAQAAAGVSRWAKMGGTIALAMDVVITKAKIMWAAISGAGTVIAGGIAIAAIAALALKLQSLNNDAKDMGHEITTGIQDKYDMSGYNERAKALEEQKNTVNKQIKAYNSHAYDTSNPIQSDANRRTASAAIQQQIDDYAKGEKELNNYNAAIQEVADKAGVTFEVAAKRVHAAGLGDVFVEGKKNSKEYKEGIDSSIKSLNTMPSSLQTMGITAEQAAAMTNDALQETQDEADEVSKEFQKVFGNLFDPADIMSQIQDVNKAIATGFGASLSSVRSDLEDELKDSADKASDAAFDSYSKGIDAQVKALQDKKDALDPPNGKKLSDKQKDDLDAQKDAIDDQISALKDGTKAKEDFEKAASPVTMSQYLDKLKSTSLEAKAFSDNLQKLRARLQDQPGMTSDMVDTIVTQFSEMGPEAAPLIDQFANATQARFVEMATSVQQSIQNMNPEIKVTLADLIAKQDEAAQKMKDLTQGLLDFNNQMNFEGGLSVGQIQQFAGLGPEYAAMIPDMVAQIKQGGPAAAQQIAQVIRTQLAMADYGTGAIPEAVTNAMNTAREVAKAGVDGVVTEGIIKGFTDNKDSLNIAMGGVATSMVDAWYQGILWSLAAKGDPFATAALKAQNTGKVTADDKNIYVDGQPITQIAHANGGIVEFFADGGFKDAGPHKAQIAKAGDMRVWAEPETGGEAYIPLGAPKRGQALPVLAEVAKRFGFQLTQYANGGFRGTPGAAMVGGTQWGAPAAPQVVAVPIEAKNVTNFNGPIQGVRMEDAERFAERKRRQSRLAGGRR